MPFNPNNEDLMRRMTWRATSAKPYPVLPADLCLRRRRRRRKCVAGGVPIDAKDHPEAPRQRVAPGRAVLRTGLQPRDVVAQVDSESKT